MFFVKTAERIITREELLAGSFGNKVFLTSITFDGGNGEYVSGVSTIQEKWGPYDLGCEHGCSKPTDVIDAFISQAGKLVESPEELALVQRTVEEAIAKVSQKTVEEVLAKGVFMDSAAKAQYAAREALNRLYQQEYCRLVWNGTICYSVCKIRYSYFFSDFEESDIKLEIKSAMGLKGEVENNYFGGYQNLRWLGVNGAFQLRMLGFPEVMTIVRLREYFGAMAYILRAKTVFESDLRCNPFSPIGEPVYNPDVISARLGTWLVETLSEFGFALKENHCYRAADALERTLRLQGEVCKITDQKVRELTKEALEVLWCNRNALTGYFEIWDSFIRDFFIRGDRNVDEYIEDICPATLWRTTPKIYGQER